jgi:hypothetical protein
MAYKSAMRRGSSVLLRRAPAAGGGGNVLGRHHRRSLSYAMTVASQVSLNSLLLRQYSCINPLYSPLLCSSFRSGTT